VIYVSDFASDRISVFADDARGNVAPLREIHGPRTGLAGPGGLAVDAGGHLYVVNRRSGPVTVYPPGAAGDVAPLRTLRAPSMRAEAVAIGAAGEVFVASRAGDDGMPLPAILRFAAGRSDCDGRIAGRRTGLTVPVGLALGDDGALYVANAHGGVVGAFAAGTTGDVAPLRAFTAATASTQGIARGARMLVLSGGCLYLYDSGAAAGAQPTAVLGRSAALHLRSAAGVAIDARVTPPLVCVADRAAGAVLVIRTSGIAPALGVASAVEIAGPATGLERPSAVLLAE
jgi:sugar lactone lactonase YvrE